MKVWLALVLFIHFTFGKEIAVNLNTHHWECNDAQLSANENPKMVKKNSKFNLLAGPTSLF